jgi:hypothetical protein
VARIVIDMSIPGLEVRSIDSPEVAELLSAAGLAVPDRPALLAVGDNRAEILTGWAMRRRLAVRLIGRRRPAALVRLYMAEWQAKLSRPVDLAVPRPDTGPVRRALGRLGTLVLLPAAAGPQQPGDATPALVTASYADAQRALASVGVQAAIRSWGPVRPDVRELASSPDPILVLIHESGDVVTFVDNASASSDNPVTLSMGVTSANGPGLRLYLANGTPLVDIVKSGAEVRVTAAATPEITPEVSWKQIEAFFTCIGADVAADCWQTCLGCAEGGWGAILNCPHCYLCAGVKAITCAKRWLL